MQTRQLITGVMLALAAFLAYQWILSLVYPPQKPALTPVEQTVTQPSPAPPTTASQPGGSASAPSTTSAPRRDLAFVAGESSELVTIGGRPDDALGLTLTPRGAGVTMIRITEQRNGRYLYATVPGKNSPYEILDPEEPRRLGISDTPLPPSFVTRRVQIREQGEQSWPLDDLLWRVTEATSQRVAFTTSLRSSTGDEEILRLTKTYALEPNQPLVQMSLTVENVSPQLLTVVVEQTGPVGIRRESPMYDMRRVVVAKNDGQAVKLATTAQRADLHKKAAAGETLRLFRSDQGAFVWTGLVNRFFGIFERQLDSPTGKADWVQVVDGTVALPHSDGKLGDLAVQMLSPPASLAPGASVRQLFEIYVGPKDPEILAAVNPAFTDATKVNYTLAHAADSRCCTFEPLPQIMTALLHWIRYAVRNYGIAIIILVIIVRTCLHPLSVYQQKQMYRLQDGMARLQPKLNDLKERYANDKVKLNQEMMKLYAEEGVNPMGSLVGMLPLFIQMPILVALWTALNADIQLRHAPFDGWWIKDLAAPDALIPFDPPINIPILGQLPLLGWMFTGITAINLLPILMGVSQWLQQKYMPKPGMHAKLEAGKKQPPAPRKPGQLSPEDQLRQQQMMGYMMTFMMPLMFYYMPAGLNLYWMATNVFGIFESLIIRKHLREEGERRAREGPKPPGPKKPGLVGRMLRHMAEQAEQIQKKADVLSDQTRNRPRKDRDDPRDSRKR